MKNNNIKLRKNKEYYSFNIYKLWIDFKNIKKTKDYKNIKSYAYIPKEIVNKRLDKLFNKSLLEIYECFIKKIKIMYNVICNKRSILIKYNYNILNGNFNYLKMVKDYLIRVTSNCTNFKPFLNSSSR